MVSTRSGFNSDGPAPTNKGCCKRFLREFFLCMVDLCILMIGILKAPMTMRVIVALVLRLLLYVTNVVALYALTATIIHNGRPAHPTGDDQFLADLVNALLQPAQYVNVQGPPPSRSRLRRSPDFHPHDLTLAELNLLKAEHPAELNILKAIMQDPIHSFPSFKSATMTTSKPTAAPAEPRMVPRRVKAPSTAPSRPGRAIPSATTSPAPTVASVPPVPTSATTSPVPTAASDPPAPTPAVSSATTSPVPTAASDLPAPTPAVSSATTSPVPTAASDLPTPTPAVPSATTSPVPTAASDLPAPTSAASSTTTLTSSNPFPSTWSPAPPPQQNPTLEPPAYGLTAWLHQIQPVLMFSVLMVALSVTVCVSQLGGSLACGHLAAGCLPRRPATTASSATGPVTAAPLHSSA